MLIVADVRPEDYWAACGSSQGKLEASDQDIRACIRRELIEELNLKVTVNELVGIYSHAYTHFKVTVHAYFCEPEAGNVSWKLLI